MDKEYLLGRSIIKDMVDQVEKKTDLDYNKDKSDKIEFNDEQLSRISEYNDIEKKIDELREQFVDGKIDKKQLFQNLGKLATQLSGTQEKPEATQGEQKIPETLREVLEQASEKL